MMPIKIKGIGKGTHARDDRGARGMGWDYPPLNTRLPQSQKYAHIKNAGKSGGAHSDGTRPAPTAVELKNWMRGCAGPQPDAVTIRNGQDGVYTVISK